MIRCLLEWFPEEIRALKVLLEEFFIGLNLIWLIVTRKVKISKKMMLYTGFMIFTVLSPIDLIIDTIPLIGVLDDIIIVLWWFVLTQPIRKIQRRISKVQYFIDMGRIDPKKFSQDQKERRREKHQKKSDQDEGSMFPDCVICTNSKADHIVRGEIKESDQVAYCNHLCLCRDCVPVFEKHFKTCPICRREYERIEKIYSV